MRKLASVVALAAGLSTWSGCEPAGEAPDPATAPPAAPEPAAAEAPAAAGNTTLGFVISHWRDPFPEVSPGDCPDGMNPTEMEHFGVDEARFQAMAKEKGYGAATAELLPPDACSDPTAQEDPGFRLFDASVVVEGLDLDGKDSRKEEGGGCAHDDFPGPDGATGIDNQHWRLVGCVKAYQPDGQIARSYESNNFVKEGFPILFEIRGVDDLRDDEEVSVRIFSSQDSVQLDASGQVMRDLSLQVLDDQRYWSDAAPGRIRDGVLTTDPVDVYIRFKQQVIDGEFYYRDLRFQAEFDEDGGIEGTLGFYWDADNYFKVNNDHHIGEFHSGRIAAHTRGYMCAGMYHAIPRIADGHPDPETGKCTSISSAIRFEGTPAFVIGAEGRSASVSAVGEPSAG